jgi:methionyl-tRNA synthetase
MKTSKQMTEEVYSVPFCRRCKTHLTKKQIEKARKKRFLPLCEHCDTIIHEALKKCLPLMQKLKLS